MSLALLEGYSLDSRICKRFPPTLNLTSSLICDNIHFSGGLPYVPPGWLLAVGALAFFAILLVRDDHEREKRKLQDRIEQLEAELVEKQKAQQTHIWPEDLWIDPKELPAGE